MSKRDVPVVFDNLRARVVAGGEANGKAHVLHCSYYNNYLLRTIWKDAAGLVDSEFILIGAAAEQAHFELAGLFETLAIAGVDERKTFASSFYSWQGFGLLDFGTVDLHGGVSRSTSQHYAEGWKEQFGASEEPMGFMTQGWLAGAAAAIYDQPLGYFSTHQLECAAATGQTDNVFELRPGDPNYALYAGRNPDSSISPEITLIDEQTGNIDASAIADAIATLPLFGNENSDDGLIKNFDVLITWHSHEYYDRISLECVRQAVAKFGDEGRHAIEPLLEEAGHRCAFRTFGGIWRSPEWEAVVEPMCSTPEDWIHGMIAIINCAGWGRVQCAKLSPEEAVFIVHDDYESIGCLKLYGKTDFAPIYLLRGGFRGMMNLIYNENFRDKPQLTEHLYDQMCRRSNAYETIVEKCIAMGDSVSVLKVRRKNIISRQMREHVVGS